MARSAPHPGPSPLRHEVWFEDSQARSVSNTGKGRRVMMVVDEENGDEENDEELAEMSTVVPASRAPPFRAAAANASRIRSASPSSRPPSATQVNHASSTIVPGRTWSSRSTTAPTESPSSRGPPPVSALDNHHAVGDV